jgi:hypothetical protein
MSSIQYNGVRITVHHGLCIERSKVNYHAIAAFFIALLSLDRLAPPS